MRTITISREFDSGGRELGKRLAGMEEKIRRCMEKASEGEDIFHKGVERNIRRYGR